MLGCTPGASIKAHGVDPWRIVCLVHVVPGRLHGVRSCALRLQRPPRQWEFQEGLTEVPVCVRSFSCVRLHACTRVSASSMPESNVRGATLQGLTRATWRKSMQVGFNRYIHQHLLFGSVNSPVKMLRGPQLHNVLLEWAALLCSTAAYRHHCTGQSR